MGLAAWPQLFGSSENYVLLLAARSSHTLALHSPVCLHVGALKHSVSDNKADSLPYTLILSSCNFVTIASIFESLISLESTFIAQFTIEKILQNTSYSGPGRSANLASQRGKTNIYHSQPTTPSMKDQSAQATSHKSKHHRFQIKI